MFPSDGSPHSPYVENFPCGSPPHSPGVKKSCGSPSWSICSRQRTRLELWVPQLIEVWCFTFNSSSSRCSIRQFNVCLFVSLITVTLKTKTDQDASAQGTEGTNRLRLC